MFIRLEPYYQKVFKKLQYLDTNHDDKFQKDIFVGEARYSKNVPNCKPAINETNAIIDMIVLKTKFIAIDPNANEA